MSVPAFVMKIFEPFTTHCPSRSSAVVRALAASEPAPGSVRPKAASLLARCEVGKPLPLLLLGAVEEDRHRPERGVRGHRDRDRRVDPRQLLDGDAYESVSAPAPPYSSGKGMPIRPSSASSATSSYGKRCSRSSSAATGATRCSRELADGRADELVLGREVEVHSAKGGRRARRSAARRTRCRRAGSGSRRASARGTRGRRCRREPTGPRRRTPAGTPPRARRRPGAGRTSSSGRRRRSRRSGGSAGASGTARRGRRSPRLPRRPRRASASSLAKTPA